MPDGVSALLTTSVRQTVVGFHFYVCSDLLAQCSICKQKKRLTSQTFHEDCWKNPIKKYIGNETLVF
jgi:hypothetical protein